MWLVHLALGLIALYVIVIAGMYVAQTWLLFPTIFAAAAQAQLAAFTQRLEVKALDGASLAGVRIPSTGVSAEPRLTLMGFGGNAWNAETTAVALHRLFPDRDVVAFHYRGYWPSGGRPSAEALCWTH